MGKPLSNKGENIYIFVFLITFFFPNRYHYIVNYALYLYENRWTLTPADDPGRLKKSHSGQQSMQKFMNYKPKVQHTHEQMRIINHNIKADDVSFCVCFYFIYYFFYELTVK